MLTKIIVRTAVFSAAAAVLMVLLYSTLQAAERGGHGAELLPFQAPLLAEHRVALIIGNARYKSSPLKNPVQDARDIAAKLKHLNFEVILRENVTHAEA